MQVIPVETGTEREVVIGGQLVLLSTTGKNKPGRRVMLEVKTKEPEEQEVNGVKFKTLRIPNPPSHQQLVNAQIRRLSDLADRMEDEMDAKRLDMPVEEVRRRRKARQRGEFNFCAWHPCNVCGKETEPDKRVYTRRWVEEDTPINSRSRKYTCQGCVDAGLQAKVDYFLTFYLPSRAWYRHCVGDWPFEVAVKEYNQGLVYREDREGGNFRYKDKKGKPIPTWNKLYKQCFASPEDFHRYCSQRKEGPLCMDRWVDG